MVEDFRLADREFITFPAHVLDQDGEVELAAAGYFEAVGIVHLFHPEADVRVQFAEQAVAQMAGGHVFAFLSGEGAVIYDELHGDGRLGDLLERDRIRMIGGAEGIADGNVGDAGDGHDGTDAGFSDFLLFQTVELVEPADLYFLLFVRIVMVYQEHFLIDGDGAVVHLADADAAYVFVVVDGADEHLGGRFRVAFRGRDIIKDRLKEGLHVPLLVCQVQDGHAVFRGRIDEGAFQLVVGCTQVDKEFQHLVDDFVRAGFRAVDLVDADDDRKA